MTGRIRKQWEDLGAHDPYWAVLTHPDKKGGRWNKDEFFRTGELEIDGLETTLAKYGVTPARRAALDYGCGVGRLTRALATRFEKVIGVDISQAMLDEARVNTRERGNVELVRGTGSDLRGIADESIDLVYSNIALQHSPSDFQRGVIRDMCRVIAPGGVIAFQNASHANLHDVKGILHLALGNRILNVARRVVYGKRSVMELHTLPKAEVIAILAGGGVEVRSAERYDSAGEAFVGFLYVATKPARR
jgi:SAM-dependent methyltransferase